AFADIERLTAQATPASPSVDVPGAGVLTRAGGGPLRRGSEVARFDVAFPVVHGSHGEDGTLQGLFELADIAYTGCGVTAAAIGMDKPMQRELFRQAGLPVLDYVVIDRERWNKSRPDALNAAKAIGVPAYVK